MSKQFIESFFPATADLANYAPIISAIYGLFLPEDVAELCPEVSLGFVRNPVLAVWAVVGMLVGALGAYRQNQLWSMAFAFFGLMNLVALPLHCLPCCTLATVKYISFDLTGALWILDCLFTGISSTSLALASLQEYSSIFPQWSESVLGFRWGQLLASISVAFTVIFGFIVPALRTTILLEMWYLIPTVYAALFTAPLVCFDLWTNQSYDTQEVFTTMCFFAGGVAMCFVGILMDFVFCRALGPPVLDSLMASTMVFGGCDLAFWGIFLRLELACTSLRRFEKKTECAEHHLTTRSNGWTLK